MAAWKDVIDIRFRSSEASCVKSGASASPFHFQPKSILQATGAKQSVKTDSLDIAENWD